MGHKLQGVSESASLTSFNDKIRHFKDLVLWARMSMQTAILGALIFGHLTYTERNGVSATKAKTGSAVVDQLSDAILSCAIIWPMYVTVLRHPASATRGRQEKNHF